MNDQQWLTVKQIAERLQVHPETVRDWLRDGKLKGYRISSRAGWRVTPEDLQRFVEGRHDADDGRLRDQE